MNAPEQGSLVDEVPDEKPHMIARVNALALKLISPFIPKDDIRYYLCGANIRPLADGTAMIAATDGHRYIVIRDPNGFTEQEIIVAVHKDGLKHAGNARHTFDVLSNGHALIADEHAIPLFLQPGRSLIDGDFPRIENVASLLGYKEGISGSVNPSYLLDALELGFQPGGVRFFTRDADSPLCFVFDGIGEAVGLECFGGIAKRRDSFESLPTWFPKPTPPNTLAEV